MVRIGRLAALIDIGPLFRGVLRYRDLKISAPVIVPERDPDGRRNWHFSSAAPGKPPVGGLAVVPKNRTQFPTLVDFGLTDGRVSYRGSSGNTLRIDLATLTIAAPDDDHPVTIALDGAYNGTPAKLEGVTGSFATLRDAAIPYETTLSVTSASARADFQGTMREPLDFEGVQGPLKISARDLGDLVRFFGGTQDIGLPLAVSGVLAHEGLAWTLDGAEGELATSAFTGTLALTEGERRQPDSVVAALDFPRLDLKAIVAGLAEGKAAPGASLSLDQRQPGRTNVQARLTAARVDYGAVRAAEMRLRGRLDMILETEAKSLFALELPIRISGPFGDISAGPSAAALVMKSPGDGAAAMPAEMRRLVDGNPCRL